MLLFIRYHEKLYAAKKIHASLTEEVSPEERETIKKNFIEQCLCCSAIQHPNVVQFFGIYYPKRSDFPIMVMELMACSLTSFIEKSLSHISNKTKISIVHGISLGLSYLHKHEPQIVHCDLSSNNVMLTNNLVAKIGDLGVAKVIRAHKKKTKNRLTQDPGTLDFMPPEVLQGGHTVYDTPVDVFSFGCVALHVFTGKWPKPCPTKITDDKTNKPIAFAEVDRRKKYLDKMVNGEVILLKELVERCLNDNPDLRPTIEEASDSVMQLRVSLH